MSAAMTGIIAGHKPASNMPGLKMSFAMSAAKAAGGMKASAWESHPGSSRPAQCEERHRAEDEDRKRASYADERELSPTHVRSPALFLPRSYRQQHPKEHRSR